MANIKLKGIGINQFGGVEESGNLTTYRATLKTIANGSVANSNSAVALAVGDVVILNILPAGMLLENATIVVSDPMSASVTGSLGFVYADGSDNSDVPQDAAYFGSGIALSAAARLSNASTKAPLTLAEDAYLVLTIAGAANTEVSRLDFIVHGERMGA